MKFFELFAGVGGFSQGIESAYGVLDIKNERAKASRDTHLQEDSAMSKGNTIQEGGLRPHCVGHSEIDKYASAVLKYNYPKVKNYGDITKIDWSKVPDFDLLTGGSPCQDFSVAGKRAGLDGERSGLFREYLRALEEKQPQYFIWENVKGAMSSRKGMDFANIISAFSEAGYSLWWQVLNAKDFGVPQNRERIFVFGTRKGSPREILFEPRAYEENTESDKRRDSNICPTIRATHYKSGDNQPIVKVERPHIAVRKNHGKFEETEDGALCIDKSYHKGFDNHGQRTGIAEGSRIRRLTPTECERLMSWKDGWTSKGNFGGEVEEISDTQRYKMCGNGVVSNCVEEIVRELIIEAL